jgi:organic hydroperoxide reductase OsmC/OhrA
MESVPYASLMSEHKVTVQWNRQDTPFTAKEYTRDHVWKFDGGSEVHASAAPQYLGNESLVDPEQAFVASLSSCHMLTFLSLAARDGFVVEDYRDEAVGMMERNAEKRIAITRVVLRPAIRWGGEAPDQERLDQLHENAHKHCFIANSVTTKIEVEPPIEADADAA